MTWRRTQSRAISNQQFINTMKHFVPRIAGNIPYDQNVEMRHIDKDGNVKPIFQENLLCATLIKNGILSPLWINGSMASIVSPFLGKWTFKKEVRNLITTAGKGGISSRINGAGAAAVFDKIGWGTGTTSPAAGDTALQTEVNASGGASTTHVIASPTTSQVTTSTTNDTSQWVGTATASGTIAITESGVFNASTGGTMLCRQTFTAINVVSGDSIQFTWKVQAS
jgi:hypothetical protein